ncbi:MAG: nickel pincer cofactor biosynthesis protein LarC [Candidatus Binatia bacterium]
MRVLYIDAFSGISGDMTVGALLGLGQPLGMDLERLRRELAVLPVHGYTLRAAERRVHGITAVKFDVDLDAEHRHDAGHAEHHHHGVAHHHHGASYGEIRTMLEGSRLEARAKALALAIFARLAAAEGAVHGVAADAVTFHEVGAVDSIVDIVGTAIGLAALDIGDVYVSALPLGSGTVRSQHGMLPVPAPATAELLRGFPVRLGDGVGELVTPTGAAIVAALAQPGAPRPAMQVEAIGYGAGTRVLADRPNLLRLLAGRAAAASERDALVELSTNIDDSNPELYEHVMEQLFAAGARDVWLTPAQMKKNRPGTVLHALAEPAARDILAAIVLRETSAIGVRFHAVERLMSVREQVSVDTGYGPVLVKISRAPDGTDNLAPEYDDCRRIAREQRVALKLVYQAAIAGALRR